MMHIISRKAFRDAAEQFPNDRTAIEDCYRVLGNGIFNTPDELRQVFPSLVNLKDRDRCWAIDISGSKLRLVAFIEFKHNRLCVRRIFAHDRSEAGRAISIKGDSRDNLDSNQLADAKFDTENLLASTDDAPVIRFINAIMTEAVRMQASDIHLEPFESRLAVRYRVDGVLQKLLEPPPEIAPLVISRLKVMAKMDIAECQSPQDSCFSLRVACRLVDVRVSTIPFVHGERVVMRLLDKQAESLKLEQLGLSAHSFKTLTKSLGLSHGIILVTGPPDSGITTTLYASLTHLNKPSSSILTIEDPIEYYLDGIGQTQVNNKVELDFARGLRAILRQDPDILMVSELHDTETVEVAVQASLTGHLVLSTVHTDTAIGAVTHLRNMGIGPFFIASSLVSLVAQRLVRLLCPHCKKRCSTLTHAELNYLAANVSQATNVHTPYGCEHCNHTGYIGKTGIYEVVEVDEKMRVMIHDGKSEQDIEDYARTRHPGLQGEGARIVLEGKTSLEEVLRVTREVSSLSGSPA